MIEQITFEELVERLVKAGAKKWEKGSASRLYMNSREVIAEALEMKVVSSVRFKDEIKAGKTKSYVDLAKKVVVADNGEVANVFRALGLSVKRF